MTLVDCKKKTLLYLRLPSAAFVGSSGPEPTESTEVTAVFTVGSSLGEQQKRRRTLVIKARERMSVPTLSHAAVHAMFLPNRKGTAKRDNKRRAKVRAVQMGPTCTQSSEIGSVAHTKVLVIVWMSRSVHAWIIST